MEKQDIAQQSYQPPPALIVLGGGSVTGKSVLAKRLRGIAADGVPIPPSAETHYQSIARGFAYITPETIIAHLPEKIRDEMEALHQQGMRHPEKLKIYRDSYYEALEERVIENLKAGNSVLLDDHCDKRKKIQHLLLSVKEQTPQTETALIGLFVGPAISEKLQAISKIEKDSPNYKFMTKTARGLRDHFEDYTALFDTTVLIQNLFNNIRIITQHVHTNGITQEVYKDAEGYKTFKRGTKDSDEKPLKAKSAASENPPRVLGERIRERDSGVFQSGSSQEWQQRILATFPVNSRVR